MNDSGKRMQFENGGMREPPTNRGAFELLSAYAYERLAIWAELGAKKYLPRNWEKGLPFSRYYQSACRHLNEWLKGNRDEDHLAAAMWNIMAIMHTEKLIELGLVSADFDDMPKYEIAALLNNITSVNISE